MTTPHLSVVDDDESVREALPDLLRELGFTVEAFASAEEFLGADAARRTSCLVLDVMMPGMSGLDLRRELDRRGERMPIVFITAHGDELPRSREFAADTVDYLLKPFSEQALLTAINAALGRA